MIPSLAEENCCSFLEKKMLTMTWDLTLHRTLECSARMATGTVPISKHKHRHKKLPEENTKHKRIKR
jgi:hypothetical protein